MTSFRFNSIVLALALAVPAWSCGKSSGSTTAPSSSSSIPSTTGNTLTARIDGTAFTGLGVTVIKSPNPGVPSGNVLGIAGSSAFVVPYTVVDITFPDAVGTYQLGPLQIPNGSVHLQGTATSSEIWDTLEPGSSGTVTVTSLTSSTAVGTFSMTVTALTPTGAAGTKVVTSGVFNVKF